MLLWIAVAGAAGALARYGLSGLAHVLFGARLPWGTLAVNLTGCFLLGLLSELAARTGWVSAELRTAVAIGFLGSLTTFSTFGLESFRALQAGDWPGMASNIGLNVGGGILLVFLGVLAARWFLTLRGPL
jgi:CrcB protein